MAEQIASELFQSGDNIPFQDLALNVYRYQYQSVEVYRRYADAIGRTPDKVKTLEDIPFLPVRFFKTHDVISAGKTPEIIFTSSGTTGQVVSRHCVAEVELYEHSFLNGFKRFYGEPSHYCILALLPSYLERGGSSLVYMAETLIRRSGHPDSGFYLDQYAALHRKLELLKQSGQKTILLGVTYALLDLAEQFPLEFQELIIMETGGMKGRRKELIREELHEILGKAFGVTAIHSEYGMTELLSQGYSAGGGIYKAPGWMKILIRDANDPFSWRSDGKTGGISIIDLANLYSCSFIATQDLGRLYPDGRFEVLGRFDDAEMRGCNLMIGS
ncbi:MAG: acyl transferase [Bacteroidia bacterium]